MIFVDSNLFVIDLRYPNDPGSRVNRRALARLARERTGLTRLLNLLEVCGILSFNLSARALRALYVHFERRYGVTVVPGAGDAARLPASACAAGGVQRGAVSVVFGTSASGCGLPPRSTAFTARVMVLNPITRERRTLATVHRAGPDDFYVRSLAWTAGGNAVVFLATTGERVEFRLAPLDGGAVRVLQEWPGVPHVGAGAIVDGFDVSPDGRRLAFVASL